MIVPYESCKVRKTQGKFCGLQNVTLCDALCGHDCILCMHRSVLSFSATTMWTLSTLWWLGPIRGMRAQDQPTFLVLWRWFITAIENLLLSGSYHLSLRQA